MIRIFEQGYEDFSTMGMGEIHPLSCVVHEEQGGAYELELEMAMDEGTLYDRLMNGRVLSVPVPSVTTPLIKTLNVTVKEFWKTNAKAKLYKNKSDVLGTYQTVTIPAVYETITDPMYSDALPYVWTVSEARTEKRWVPNGNKLLQTIQANKKVTILSKADATWWKVATAQGKTGYVLASKLVYVEQYLTTPGDEIQERQVREQLFRIYRTEKDTRNLTVKAWARHVYYDLLGVAVTSCKLQPLNVTSVLYAIDQAANPSGHGFEFLTNSTKTLRKCDYTHRSVVDAHLNPDDGVLKKGNLRIVRDNYDVFFLNKSSVTRNSITYAQNLKGVTVDINSDGIVNRIIPVGKDAKGAPLYRHATWLHVNSPRNDASTEIRCKVIEYNDVKVDDDTTITEARTKLNELAANEFKQGIDLPDISVTVDFLQLGDTEEYLAYKELDRLYLSDTVRIIDKVHGVDIIAEVSEYDFDCLTGRYTRIGVGVTRAMRTIGSVGAYMLPNGSVSGTKLALGSVDGSRLEALSVKSAQIGLAAIETAHIGDAQITSAKIGEAQIDTAHIKEATIEDLTAASVTAIEGTFGEITAGTITSGSIFTGIIDAVKARIGYLISENLTTDELYARIATIAVAQITAANIESANITWADIENLTTAIANIAIGEIGTADIDWAHIKDLVTETAILTQGVGGEFYFAKLSVTDANVVNLTTGKLVVRGDDGNFYQITIDENGTIIPKLEQVFDSDLADAGTVIDEDENIIYGGITAGKLDVQSIFAEDAVIKSLIAANIDVDTFWAREGTVEQLNAKLLLTDDFITIQQAVDGVVAEANANKSYIRLGNMLDSDSNLRQGVAIGEGLLLDESGNIVRDSTSVQIFSDRQTFNQNGEKVMELKSGAITGAKGNFGEVTTGGKWRQTVDAAGTFAIMWEG